MISKFMCSFKKLILLLLILSVFFASYSFPSYALDYMEEAEQRKFLDIESNNFSNWPVGPSIGAKAAILMDANTGAILYAKNIHEKLYPASITKLLTTYIAVNQCNLNETVTFSDKAVGSIRWWEDANMGVNPGTQLSVKDVLSGILIGSANEAAYALAEHISGDIIDFSKLMNETAKSLGCKNSNFVTPNGIHHEDHYTTAYDMALIAKAFFSQESLTQLSGTLSFQVPVNSTQKKKDIILTSKNLLLPGKSHAYDYLLGSKTGYTDEARQTLVSCAQKDGMKLICVILKEEKPYQFTDTIDLFDYGFNNFSTIYLKNYPNPYTIENKFFSHASSIFGNYKTILSLDENDYIVLPNTLSFEDLNSTVTYDDSDNSVCTINYFYDNHLLGKINVLLSRDESYVYSFGNKNKDIFIADSPPADNIIFINIFQFVTFSIFIFFFIFLITTLRIFFIGKRSKSVKKTRFKRKFHATRKLK